MLRLALVAVLLASAATAQDADYPVPTTGDRVLLVLGSGAGAVLTLWTGPGALLGAGLGTYATSAALGLRPTIGGAALDTAAGTAVAVGTYWVNIYVITEIAGRPHDLSAGIGSALLGLATGAAVIGVSHGARLGWLRSRALEVAPAALSVPGGGLEAGLRLSVRL